jgi:hypothetical protein
MLTQVEEKKKKKETQETKQKPRMLMLEKIGLLSRTLGFYTSDF